MPINDPYFKEMLAHGAHGGTEMSPHPHGNAATNPDVAHEESDINVRAIIWFVVVLDRHRRSSIHLSMWGMFRVFDHMEAKIGRRVLSPLVG